MFTPEPSEDQVIAEGCDILKALADELSELAFNELVVLEGIVQQIFARQVVFLVRQVHGIVLLTGFPFYAEQAGQLVRGLAEMTRTILWIDQPDEDREATARGLAFWQDGIMQARSKHEAHKNQLGSDGTSEAAELERQESALAAAIATHDGEIPAFSNAKDMWDDVGHPELYSVFRWESDPAHGSAVALSSTVQTASASEVELGGRNPPWNRVKRLGSTLVLLQLAGTALLRGLGLEAHEWAASKDAAEDTLNKLFEIYLMPPGDLPGHSVVSAV